MLISQARLQSDLTRWQAQGWVSEQGAAAIRRDLASQSSTGFGLYGALAVLGAILLGFAAMSFVAAHWDELSKLAKLTLIGTGLIGCYAAAYDLFRRNLDGFAHAAVLAGVALFGGAIMLIAQMYHMDGNPPDAVWLWALGALAAGLLLRSNPALAASVVLICIWSFMTVQEQHLRVHWGFLPMWALAASGIAMTRWRQGMHLLALVLSGWIVLSCLQFDRAAGRYALLAIGLLLSGTAIVGGDRIDRWRQISGTMLAHGMTLAYIALFMIQFATRSWFGGDTPAPSLWIWGSLTLALLIGAMAAAWRIGHQRALWMAYLFFSIEIFALYIAKIGSLLGTSAFFFIMGLLVIALATIAYRMRAETTNLTGAAS
jgi:uncharacterized membrane protein